MPRGQRTQGMPVTNTANQEEQMEGMQAATNQQNETAMLPEMQVQFTQFNPDKDIIATADVKIGNLLTVRNVKVKEDDYGYNVVMPKTQMKEDGKYKDSVYFTDRAVKEQFDEAVRTAYKDTVLAIELDEAAQDDAQGEETTEDMEQESGGMSMGM